MNGKTPKAMEAIKKLMIIGEKQGTISLNDLAKEVGLSPEDTLIFLRQVFPEGHGAEIYNKDQNCMVDMDANLLQYMLPLSPAEWMQVYKILEDAPPEELKKNQVLRSLKNKISDNGPIRVVMEILSQLELWDHHLNEAQQGFLQQLESAINMKQMVRVTTKQDKSYNIFPSRIIHLEGKLSLIAEDSQDHCMIIVAINELADVSLQESLKTAKVSSYEIEEFIVAVRSMNEKETRLILKIHDPQSVNLFPQHHFLGKPCMITNPEGDLIWAAYIEPGDDLYEWLLTLGEKVEILDPAKFKDDYFAYCKTKLMKIA
jgi:hypothetical protein